MPDRLTDELAVVNRSELQATEIEIRKLREENERLKNILDMECKVLGHERTLSECRIEGDVKSTTCFRCGTVMEEKYQWTD